MEASLIGGIFGGIFGIGGGAIGTYFSIKNTNGPLEQVFMIRASITAWIAIIIFLLLLLLLPQPYNHLMWIPYGILLPLGIIKLNRKQAELREIEQSQL